MHTILLISIPVLMAVVGLVSLTSWLNERIKFLRATASIEAFSEFKDSDGDTMFRPIFEFEYDGKLHRVTDPMAMGWRSYEIGQMVSISFPRESPERARIDRLWLPIVFALVTIVGLAIGVYILLEKA